MSGGSVLSGKKNGHMDKNNGQLFEGDMSFSPIHVHLWNILIKKGLGEITRNFFLFYFMKKKGYKLVIELLCPECSNKNCPKHLAKKMVLDNDSGIEFEIVCICRNH